MQDFAPHSPTRPKNNAFSPVPSPSTTPKSTITPSFSWSSLPDTSTSWPNINFTLEDAAHMDLDDHSRHKDLQRSHRSINGALQQRREAHQEQRNKRPAWMTITLQNIQARRNALVPASPVLFERPPLASLRSPGELTGVALLEQIQSEHDDLLFRGATRRAALPSPVLTLGEDSPMRVASRAILKRHKEERDEIERRWGERKMMEVIRSASMNLFETVAGEEVVEREHGETKVWEVEHRGIVEEILVKMEEVVRRLTNDKTC